jgi:hypothetical protein
VQTSGAWADSPKTGYLFPEAAIQGIKFYGSPAGNRFEDVCIPDIFNIPCNLFGGSGDNYLRGGPRR